MISLAARVVLAVAYVAAMTTAIEFSAEIELAARGLIRSWSIGL